MKISEIWIYPIKSCGGIRLSESALLQTGLAGDRQWMLVDESGKFITQREKPELAAIQMSRSDESFAFQFGSSKFVLEGPTEDKKIVKIWGQDVKASFEKNQQATEFFSDYLKQKVNLMTTSPAFRRRVREDGIAQPVATFFADSHPLLVTTVKSLNALSKEAGEKIPMDRFRPNLVIDGDFKPFAEELWTKIQIGTEVKVAFRKKCDRCVMITLDQQTGERKSPMLLKTLMKLKAPQKKPYFGMRAWSENLSTLIHEGDPVQILSTSAG